MVESRPGEFVCQERKALTRPSRIFGRSVIVRRSFGRKKTRLNHRSIRVRRNPLGLRPRRVADDKTVAAITTRRSDGRKKGWIGEGFGRERRGAKGARRQRGSARRGRRAAALSRSDTGRLMAVNWINVGYIKRRRCLAGGNSPAGGITRSFALFRLPAGVFRLSAARRSMVFRALDRDWRVSRPRRKGNRPGESTASRAIRVSISIGPETASR